jgi:hypothetical protein
LDGITFAVRFVLPGAEAMQSLDGRSDGLTSTDRRARLMHAKELSAALNDRLHYLEVRR